jgi:hypothetical protein
MSIAIQVRCSCSGAAPCWEAVMIGGEFGHDRLCFRDTVVLENSRLAVSRVALGHAVNRGPCFL